MENSRKNRFIKFIKDWSKTITITLILGLVKIYYVTNGIGEKVVNIRGVVVHEKLAPIGIVKIITDSDVIQTNSDSEFVIPVRIKDYKWPFSESFFGVTEIRNMIGIEKIDENEQIGSITINVEGQRTEKPILYLDIHNHYYNAGNPIIFETK
jgi:hypothetical protein